MKMILPPCLLVTILAGCSSVSFSDSQCPTSKDSCLEEGVYFYERQPVLLVGQEIDSTTKICRNTFSTVVLQGKRRVVELKGGLLGNASFDVTLTAKGFIGGMDASVDGAFNSAAEVIVDLTGALGLTPGVTANDFETECKNQLIKSGAYLHNGTDGWDAATPTNLKEILKLKGT